MAKMHSRKRGRAGSKKPVITSLPEWVSMDANSVKDLVVALGKEGKKPSEIGLVLRDLHGVPSAKAVTGKTVTDMLREGNLAPELPENLMNLIVKAVKVQKHLSENKKDNHSKRGLESIESKIKRLVKYYQQTGVLPMDWRYTPERAALLVK
ncbi:MAG TPA: 30S ribosomal protein S15 [archaeon]|nr:30S ribosomal protein S15 [archaeon]HLD80993.1 30S ribosomal protein S15 [archaeon]